MTATPKVQKAMFDILGERNKSKQKAPVFFTYICHPYQHVIFKVDHVDPIPLPKERTAANEYRFRRAERKWVQLSGTIVEGSEVSRLFQYTATRNLTGKFFVIEVPPDAYEVGRYEVVGM